MILIRRTDKKQPKSPNQNIDLGFLVGKELRVLFQSF